MNNVTDAMIKDIRAKLDAVLERHREQGWPEPSPIAAAVQTIEAVNGWFNDMTDYVTDFRKHRETDLWRTFYEVVTEDNFECDCEEPAIAKALALTELAHTTWLAIVGDRERSTPRAISWHALCLVGEAPAEGERDERLVLDIAGRMPSEPWPVWRYQRREISPGGLGVYEFYEGLTFRIIAADTPAP